MTLCEVCSDTGHSSAGIGPQNTGLGRGPFSAMHLSFKDGSPVRRECQDLKSFTPKLLDELLTAN